MTDWSEYHDTKSIEDRVVSTVYHQTTGPQPDMVAESTMLVVLGRHGNLAADDVRAALDSAVENGRVVSADGRYALADDEPRPGPESV
jgi:3-oxoacyl-[acyl-carrier-protein] synthase III